MIKRIINIANYWEVIVYYNIDYNFFDYIEEELKSYNTPVESIRRIYHNMRTNAKAFTCSNYYYKVSIIGFNIHSNKYDYINSIIHEAEHVKQAILKYYNIKDEGENAAYAVAYIATKMLQIKMMK